MNKKLFSLEEASNSDEQNVTFVTSIEEEMSVYATISNPEGLEECSSKYQHTNYNIKISDTVKLRLRNIKNDNGVENVLTFKEKLSSSSNIESNVEYNAAIGEELTNLFSRIDSKPTTATRYIFISENVTFNFTKEDGEKGSIELPSVKYEIDVFPNNNNMCKIEVEFQDIFEALKNIGIEDPSEKVAISIKVTHLPFKPIDVFGLVEDDSEKVNEFWNKIKNHE